MGTGPFAQYDRSKHPIRFWMSAVLNLVIVAICAGVIVAIIANTQR
jgi:hypothetical protein